MESGIAAGLAAYRWAAWGWMGAVLLLSRRELTRPIVAYALVGLALAITVSATVALRTEPRWSLSAPALGIELATGGALIALDGWVYGQGHAFSIAQSLGVAWPIAGVLAVGVAKGAWAGGGAGVLLGAARMASVRLNGVTDLRDDQIVSLITTTVLFTLAGSVAGHVTELLRRAQREISAARAREEMARTLHDGVLQTLAVIERRADDPVLARLAREQERGLREYIAGLRSTADPDLASALRAAGAHFEDSFGGRAEVIVADDLPSPRTGRAAALAGAVGEALTNAGKHGSAGLVTVFVEPQDGGVFCSVKDDGTGFDPAITSQGLGLSHSITERLAEVGGRAEVESRVGGPTEVRMWVP